MVLDGCSAEQCGRNGVSATDEGSKADVVSCILKENGEHAAVAAKMAEVTVKGCNRRQHGSAGYFCTPGGQMTVSSSTSDGDKQGCVAERAGFLTMEGVIVDGIVQSGKLLWP